MCLSFGYVMPPPNKKTTEVFIREVHEKYNGKYGCEEVDYQGAKTPVVLVCPYHGRFSLIPNVILNKHRSCACQECGLINKARKRQLDIEVFKARLFSVFGDDVSLVEDTYYEDRPLFVCSKHGEFRSDRTDVLSLKQGCPKCAKNSRKSVEFYVDQFTETHGDRYDYSLVEVVDTSKKVKIVCKEHGVFEQTIHSHIKGRGCMKCAKPVHDITSFVSAANKVHGNRYSYTESKYVSSLTKVRIECLEHGYFWQTPHSHINSACGCPLCAINTFSEADVGYLYVFAAEGVVKIGITKQNYKNRLNSVRSSSGYDFKLVKLFESTGVKVMSEEKNLLSVFRSMFCGVGMVFDGSTECFATDSVDTIVKYCEDAMRGQ